jgi:hypothetical protein
MPGSNRLREAQRWVQRAILDPGSDAATLRGAGRRITPSRTLSSAERIDIYRRMYRARMYDALAADYPCLQHFLGEDRFAGLVEAYVSESPSSSYTLNRLGDRLPEFLAVPRGLPRQAFLYDLARLELAMTFSFDEEEAPALEADAITAMPAGAWEHAQLDPIPALRLLETRYPVGLYADAVRDGGKPPAIRPRRSWMAVYRRNYLLYRLDLAPAAYKLLYSLAAGLPLARAIAAAASGPRSPRPRELFQWFRDWTAAGLFRGVSR